MNKGGMGGHQSTNALKEEWLTPPYILAALGPFDLDPCAPIRRPWPIAGEHYTIEDNGLAKPWHGVVWLNPPYGPKTGSWLARLADHNNGIALVFARTETDLFFSHIWNKAAALLFLRGRIRFHHVNGTVGKSNSGAPSVLVAYGQECAVRLLRCSKLDGHKIRLV